jgi:hypothetical protein
MLNKLSMFGFGLFISHSAAVLAGKTAEAAVFGAMLLPGLAALELVAELGGQFAPRGGKRMVAGFRMDIGSGHGEVRTDAVGGRALALLFQHDMRGGDGQQAAERRQALPDEVVEAAVVVEAAILHLKFHGVVFLHNGISFFG